MPTFDFTSPDGKSYSVDGPDGATPEQAFQMLQQHLGGAAPAPSVGIGEDLAKTVIPSTGRMVAGMAGLPGDLSNLLAKGSQAATDYIAGKIGIDPGPRAMRPLLPTSSDLEKPIESITGNYQPQRLPGQLLDKAIQFAPAVIGGPEALAAKLATRVAAPAVASEAAGKLTEGTAAQPYAEAIAALTGAAAAPAALRKLTAASAARSATAAIPEVTDLKAAARAGYQHPEVQAVRIDPGATLDLADQIKADLQHGPNSGFRPANEPKVFSAVDELGTAAAKGRSATVADLDNVRQVLGNAAKEKDATGQLTRQAVAANRAIEHIDKFLPNLRQADLLAGDAAKANAILDTARQNWGAAKRAEMVQTLAKNAEINAASSHSGANIQNATKQAFKPLLKNNFAKAGGYNDAEKAALNSIVRGTWGGSAARAAGNLLGGGGGLGMLAGASAGYEAGGLPGAIATGLAGRGLKMMGNRSTFNAVQKLDQLIRSRAPEALKIAAANPQLAAVLPPKSVRLLRTMILSEPSLRAVNQQRDQIGQPDANYAG